MVWGYIATFLAGLVIGVILMSSIASHKYDKIQSSDIDFETWSMGKFNHGETNGKSDS